MHSYYNDVYQLQYVKLVGYAVKTGVPRTTRKWFNGNYFYPVSAVFGLANQYFFLHSRKNKFVDVVNREENANFVLIHIFRTAMNFVDVIFIAAFV